MINFTYGLLTNLTKILDKIIVTKSSFPFTFEIAADNVRVNMLSFLTVPYLVYKVASKFESTS